MSDDLRSSNPPARALAVALVLLVGVTFIAGLPVRAASPPPLRARGKPFAVGVRTETFTDHSRPTAAHGDIADSPSRTLETTILYPTTGHPSATDLPGAAALQGAGRFPLLVRAHGFGGSPTTAEPLMRRWAAAGYVVALPKFPLSNHDAPGGPTRDYLNQPADISFVITQMTHLPRRDADLSRIINRNAIGVTGYSDGAVTTLAVAFNSCCHDPRIKAVSAVAGAELTFPGGRYFTGPPIPLFLAHGTADPNYERSVQTFADAKASKFFLTLIDAPHALYVEPWRTVVAHSEIDFFDHYLKHEPKTLARLRTDANLPGVAALQQG